MFTDEDAGRYLFHYTTLESFLGHILPSRRLRFSPFSAVNDPREAKDWLCSIRVDTDVPLPWDVIDAAQNFTALLKKSAKVLCFTRDDPLLDPQRVAHLYGRGYAHPRMWDRYADRHRGVCLAFDVVKLGDEIAASVADRGRLVSRWVTYDDMPTAEVDAFTISARAVLELGWEAAMSQHFDLHHGALYFYKSTDWATEFEFRWVLLSSHNDEYEFVDLRSSLSAVIFGEAYPTDSIPMVRNLLADSPVIFAHMTHRNGHPLPLPAPE